MRLSAGAISRVCPIMQVPTSPTISREALGGNLRQEAGNRLELVERPAGVAEAAPAHHRHRDAARGDERREAEAHLVADAAGRVLVDLDPGHGREVEHAPEWSIASVSATVSASSRPRKKTAMRSADIW